MKFGLGDTGFRKVNIAFLLVFAMVLANVIACQIIISSNNSRLSKVTEEINPFVEELQKFNLLVTESKMYTTNWVYLENGYDDKQKLRELHDKRYPELKIRLTGFLEEEGMKQDRDSLNKIFTRFENLLGKERKVMASLVKMEDYENAMKFFTAIEMVESVLLPETDTIMTQLKKVINRNLEKVDTTEKEMKSSFSKMLWFMLIVSSGLFLFIIIALGYITVSIKKPVLKMKEIIGKLAKGELPDEELEIKDNVIGEMAGAVNKLSVSFTKTSSFAQEIGRGNLTVPFEKLGENDRLGNALISMRESLRKYSESL